MKVAILLENEAYPQDVRVRNEAETLSGSGYEVSVVAPRLAGQARREHVCGVTVIRYWLPPTNQNAQGFLLEYLVAHLQLARIVATLLIRGLDVLHVSNPPDTLVPLVLLAKLAGCRTVFDNHDLFPELYEVRFGRGIVHRLLRAAQRLAFSVPDLVITTNESQREVVLSRVSRPPESVVVVRNGPRTFELSPQRAGAERGAPTDRLELVFVGALEPQDGVVVLAEVLALLRDRHHVAAHLRVVGAGSCAEGLRKRAGDFGVADLITFTGRVPHAEVGLWLQRADICVDPAPCNELNHRSTMIKIAEYMAAGKPIVAFDLRETRYTAGEAALYAPCGDVDTFAGLIARLAGDTALRTKVRDAAAERAPELGWDKSAGALLSGYAALPEQS